MSGTGSGQQAGYEINPADLEKFLVNVKTYADRRLQELEHRPKPEASPRDSFAIIRGNAAQKRKAIEEKNMLRERLVGTYEQIEKFYEEASQTEKDIALGRRVYECIRKEDSFEIFELRCNGAVPHKWSKYSLLRIKPPDEKAATAYINERIITPTMKEYDLFYKEPPKVLSELLDSQPEGPDLDDLWKFVFPVSKFE